MAFCKIMAYNAAQFEGSSKSNKSFFNELRASGITELSDFPTFHTLNKPKTKQVVGIRWGDYQAILPNSFT